MPNPITKLHQCFTRRLFRSPPARASSFHDPDNSSNTQHVPLTNNPSCSASSSSSSSSSASSSSSSSCTSSPLKPLNSSYSFSSTSTSAASDLSAAIATRRLLPASPGRSNSIADSSTFAFGIGLAVPTYSPDPQAEFRRSMEEMAAAMGLLDPVAHRDRLYELLLCYLTLNRKNAHKYIVGAFADLLSALEAAS